MKKLLLAAAALAIFSLPAAALPVASITPHQALANRGQCVNIEGTASVRKDPQRLGMLIDLDGKDSPAFGYILPENVSQFPDLASLEGQKVNLTGVVGFYLGRAQIVLSSARQLKPAGSGAEGGLTHLGPQFATGASICG